MSLVAASEAELLSLARALVGEVRVEAVEPLLRTRRPLAARQGPTSMRLVEQTLAAGCVLQLARRGGWRDRRHLHSGQVVSGRLWEQNPDTALQFGQASLLTLRWMLENALALPKDVPPLPFDGPLSPADELVAYLACDLLARAGCGGSLARAGLFHRSALCWLGRPVELGSSGEAQPPDAARFAGLLAGPSTPLVEALQDDLCARYVELTRDQARLRSPAQLLSQGQAQAAVLDAFLDAAERSGREDLALFLVEAGRRLLPPGVTGRHFAAALDPRTPLSERGPARRAAGALLRALLRLAGSAERWRATPFFEDGYAAAQMLLGAWGSFGEEELPRAQAMLRQLETPDVAAPGGEAPAMNAGSPP